MAENLDAVSAAVAGSTLLKAELAELAGVSIRFIERLVGKGVIVPSDPGGHGRGLVSRFALMEALGVATCAAFVQAGLHVEWAYTACETLATMEPGKLLLDLAAGRTFLALRPEGGGVLVEPYLSPKATREDRLLLARLNVASIYKRLLARLLGKVPEEYRPALAELAARIGEQAAAASDKG
jgi:hypothetical protein